MREIYCREALNQFPRLFSLMDRNTHSKTYGSFHRVYWHDKLTDVACAHPQIAVLALALVYNYPFPDNVYFKNDKVKEWCIAGMRYWTRIQKPNGSFDEHYPNEHSFGATCWTLQAILESLTLLKDEVQKEDHEMITKGAFKAARWLVKNDEPGKLSNHQAIAAYALLLMSDMYGEKDFSQYASERVNRVLENQSKEGWFLEYDGADLGYQTTTISLLAKIYRKKKEERILKALKRAIDFTSYFVYPDGSFGGFVGSRQTSHFHPHGFEILADEIPIAGAIANKLLEGIVKGTCLTPSSVDDKHFPHLQIEFLQAYIDHYPRPPIIINDLPYRKGPFNLLFNDAGILVTKGSSYYAVVGLSKGGVFKIFDLARSTLFISDGGFVGTMENGKSITNHGTVLHEVKIQNGEFTIRGGFVEMSSETLTPSSMVFSRLFLSVLGRGTKIPYLIKGYLIRRLITNRIKVPIEFTRHFHFNSDDVQVVDILRIKGGQRVASLDIVSEFSPRFVPASRYFNLNELMSINGDLHDITRYLNHKRYVRLHRSINLTNRRITLEIKVDEDEGSGRLKSDQKGSGKSSDSRVAKKID